MLLRWLQMRADRGLNPLTRCQSRGSCRGWQACPVLGVKLLGGLSEGRAELRAKDAAKCAHLLMNQTLHLCLPLRHL